MSTFHKPYTVCSISSSSDFMGVAVDREDCNVILTLKNNMIVIRNIDKQVAMKSWKTQDRLTSMVIYDVNLKKYVGVFCKRFLRVWDENCDNLTEGKKYSFKRNLDKVVTVGSDTFVIFTNGTCNLLTDAIETRKLKDEHNLRANCMLKANIHKFSNNRLMLTYFEENASVKNVTLVCVPLYKHVVTPKRFKITRAKIYAKLVNYIVYEGAESPMLCTVWTDQRVFVMPLTDDTESDMSPGKYITILTDLNLSCPVSVAIVATNILAIYGKRAGKPGAMLLLFDLNFKVIIVRHYYEQYLPDSCLYVANQHIYLAIGQKLMATMYKLGKSPLADAIGKQHEHILDSAIIMNSIDEEELKNEGLKPIKEHDVLEIFAEQPLCNVSKNKNKLKPADGQTIPYQNVETFNKKLDELLQQHFEIELLKTKSRKKCMEIELMENIKDTGFHHKQLCHIVAAMENSGASQCEITERLCAVLIKTDQLAEIGNVLRRYTYISSISMGKVLRYLLQKLKEHDLPDVVKGHRTLNRKIAIEEVLDLLLSCEFDDKVLQLYIRNEISEAHLRLLLQYLYDSITSKKVNHNFTQRPSNNVPSMHIELQIFRWFGLLLQAYYHRMVLFKDKKFIDLLIRWRKVFQSYRHEAAELEQTADHLYNLIQKHKLDKQNVLYSIQRINF